MGHLVEVIAKGLVDNPEQVNVNEIEGNRSVILELKVALRIWKSNCKQGRIAKAIRTVVKQLPETK